MPIGFAVQGVTQPDPSDIAGIIRDAANRYGVDPAYLAQVAAAESSNNPKAVSPTGAKGLFQFSNGTARQYGLRNPFDPAQNADAAARLTRDNQGKLTDSLGRAPSSSELYLAHQQGAAGASAILKNPNQNAVDALAPVYGGNRTKAAQAVSVNGGSPDVTAGDFANKWSAKFGSPGANATAQAPPPDANASSSPLSLAAPAASDDSGGKVATGLTGNSTAKNFGTAVGNGAKISSAFTTGISAPSLMPLSQTTVAAPVIPTGMAPANDVIPNSLWPS
jgi:Transglycosylase SLT domain